MNYLARRDPYKLTAAIAFLLLANSIGLHAEQRHFYFKETDNFWSVVGEANTDTGQATCFGQASRKDGSYVEIHRSLVDAELWAFIHDTEWEISGHDRGELRWNFFGANKSGIVGGFDFEYIVKDKNTILILQIKPKPFSDALWNAKYFTLVMPGNLSNLFFGFENKGASMLAVLAECIKENQQTYKDFKPSLEKVPDAVKEQL